MNKIFLISCLLLGVGLFSSSSATPFVGGLTNLVRSISQSAVSQAVVTPLVGGGETLVTNPGAVVSTGSLTPAPGQLNATKQEILLFPAGLAEVLRDQLEQDQLTSNVNNTEAILQNYNASNPLKTAYTGVKIGGGSHSNSVGLLSLPTYSLCPLEIQYTLTSCFICNQDCYVAHNLWGGKCGKSPIDGGDTCLCAESQEEADEKGIAPQSTTTCNVYNPFGGVVDFVIGAGFRIRSILLQCVDKGHGEIDSTGCNVDCVQNHGMVDGLCNWQYPNVDNVLYSSQEKLLFCTCVTNATGTPTLTTTGRATPLPRTTATPLISSSSSSEEVSSSSSTSAPASSTSSTSGYSR